MAIAHDELEDYIFSPRTELRDRTFAVYGVRYPEHVLARFRNGLDVAYGGWLPNVLVPSVYSAARVVLHVPRAPVRRPAARHPYHPRLRSTRVRRLLDLAAVAGYR